MGVARTISPRNLEMMFRQVESVEFVGKSIDCLIEKTETHVLVGLFLLCLLC